MTKTDFIREQVNILKCSLNWYFN